MKILTHNVYSVFPFNDKYYEIFLSTDIKLGIKVYIFDDFQIFISLGVRMCNLTDIFYMITPVLISELNIPYFF